MVHSLWIRKTRSVQARDAVEKKKLHVQVGKTLVKEEPIVNIAPTPKELHVQAKICFGRKQLHVQVEENPVKEGPFVIISS